MATALGANYSACFGDCDGWGNFKWRSIEVQKNIILNYSTLPNYLAQ